MGLFFTKDVVGELVVKILDKLHLQRVSKNSFLKLKLQIWGYRQVTTDAFTFPKEILKEKLHFSGCFLFLKKLNNESVVI